jgi:hypothetical protein
VPLPPDFAVVVVDLTAVVVVVLAAVVAVLVVVAFATTLAFVHGLALVLFWPALQVGTVFDVVPEAAYAPNAPTTPTIAKTKSGKSRRMMRVPTGISFFAS